MVLPHLKTSLYLELQKGKFCYVSEPTATDCDHIGKATCREMTQRGYRSILVSSQANPKARHLKKDKTWDQYTITSIWQSLHPQNKAWLAHWMNTTTHLTSQERLIQFADDLLLSDLCEGPLLLCLSNIDSLLNEPLAISELLAWVAHCYELRDTHLTYHHLSIVAFGTALPTAITQQSQPVVLFENIHTPKPKIKKTRQQQFTKMKFAHG